MTSPTPTCARYAGPARRPAGAQQARHREYRQGRSRHQLRDSAPLDVLPQALLLSRHGQELPDHAGSGRLCHVRSPIWTSPVAVPPSAPTARLARPRPRARRALRPTPRACPRPCPPRCARATSAPDTLPATTRPTCRCPSAARTVPIRCPSASCASTWRRTPPRWCMWAVPRAALPPRPSRSSTTTAAARL